MTSFLTNWGHRVFECWRESLFRGERRQKPASYEEERQAQLITVFSLVGGVFALIYGAFYLLIGHRYGAATILFFAALFLALSSHYVRQGRIQAAGHVFVMALLCMFFILSLLEGGVEGHAVAWLACVPVCAQLLLGGRRSATVWTVLMIGVVSVFAFLYVLEVKLPFLYPDHWHGWVTALGYIGLGLFLACLGYLAEYYRRKAMQERNLAEKKLQEAVNKLSFLNEEKNEFLGIAAHDLNNPLSLIRGYAQLIHEAGGLHPEFREYGRLIEDSADRMKRIVGDVLDVNQIDSGTYPIEIGCHPLHPIVESVQQEFSGRAAAKGLHWKVQVDPVFCEVDASAVRQVVENLISNAVKYAAPGGEIALHLSEQGEEAVLRVRNEGRGFSPEDLDKLFQRFGKLSTRPTGGEHSVGLGLSITKKLVEAMGGEIGCESTLNEHATFLLRLPKALEVENGGQKNAPGEPGASQPNGKPAQMN